MRPFSVFFLLQIFGPDVGQKLFFDETMKQVVKDVLNGQNWLVYTYGNTNSGKTHTIQGNGSTNVNGSRHMNVCFYISVESIASCSFFRQHQRWWNSASFLSCYLQ